MNLATSNAFNKNQYEVSDINGRVKKNTFGQKLEVHPDNIGKYAGMRLNAQNLMSTLGEFKRPAKNTSQAFSHLDNSDEAYKRYLKSTVQQDQKYSG